MVDKLIYNYNTQNYPSDYNQCFKRLDTLLIKPTIQNLLSPQRIKNVIIRLWVLLSECKIFQTRKFYFKFYPRGKLRRASSLNPPPPPHPPQKKSLLPIDIL